MKSIIFIPFFIFLTFPSLYSLWASEENKTTPPFLSHWNWTLYSEHSFNNKKQEPLYFEENKKLSSQHSTRIRLEKNLPQRFSAFLQVGQEIYFDYGNTNPYSHFYTGPGIKTFFLNDSLFLLTEFRVRLYYFPAPTSIADFRNTLVFNKLWIFADNFYKSNLFFIDTYSETAHTFLAKNTVFNTNFLRNGYRVWANKTHSLDSILELRTQASFFNEFKYIDLLMRPSIRYQIRPTEDWSISTFFYQDIHLNNGASYLSALFVLSGSF